MSFLAPMGFLFALALPVVVTFYILKRRRTVHLVPSSLLWQRFISDAQANAPFQKLRKNWLLILQLLLLLLLVLALSRPYFAGEAESGAFNVLIIDTSASMQSRDVSPSRFDQAKAEALKWIDGKRDNEQAIVLQVAGRTEVVQSETGNKAALRRAVESLRVTDGPTRIVEALKLAESLIQARSDAQIHLFSDGAFPSPTEFENRPLPLVYHQVGEGGNNVGIVSIDVRAEPLQPTLKSVFVEVHNFSGAAVESGMELLFNDQVLEMQLLELPATNSSSLVFRLQTPTEGIIRVRLPHEDDYAPDNTAALVSLLPAILRLRLVTQGNVFLERALRSLDHCELLVVDNVAPGAGDFDVTIIDNLTPAFWPEENVLAINVAESGWFGSVGTLEAPVVVNWHTSHELMRYVSFEQVLISESLRVDTPVWGRAIVETTNHPLIVAGERGRQRILWVGFDVMNSNWPRRSSFPIFVMNAAEWLNPHLIQARRRLVRAGEPIRYPLRNAITNATIVTPEGDRGQIVVPATSSELMFGQTDAAGIYRMLSQTNEVLFAVNALDPDESNIRPAMEIQLGEYNRTAAAAVQPARVEYWRWFVVAGLLFLMFEWWFYHRRTA